ncbi:unnamed protein product [Linum tenue]|uniref:Uncharacterized protein n=1 Tax=Linum tenue TaxID=586396 RepID=A0AAV0NYI0_9ROSI|nr:unnamed protein product [Linum tenue]
MLVIDMSDLSWTPLVRYSCYGVRTHRSITMQPSLIELLSCFRDSGRLKLPTFTEKAIRVPTILLVEATMYLWVFICFRSQTLSCITGSCMMFRGSPNPG